MKVIHQVCCGILIAIGAVHIVFGIFSYDTLSLNALWFAGSGLAIIFAGFVNLFFLKNLNSRSGFIIAQLSNLLFLAFIILVNMVSPMLPGLIGLVVTLVLLFTSWKMKVG